MGNQIFRAIGLGIAGTLLLLFVLPALLRLLIVAAVVSFVYRLVQKRYRYKRAAYYYRQDHPQAGYHLPPHTHQPYRQRYNPVFESNHSEEPVTIKIG
ncbi:hypothetical protein C7N43_02170 [Sphingobacteriales bacterium UPWRP_1]|nr:hypothetical protein B6N25_07250 [Sphingobacteriales bacterium TSM_CSS]PSJ78691.1 hypothetical protein C7N43_02170 [Sphingobacteriales bacterium UPWRP_1]